MYKLRVNKLQNYLNNIGEYVIKKEMIKKAFL